MAANGPLPSQENTFVSNHDLLTEARSCARGILQLLYPSSTFLPEHSELILSQLGLLVRKCSHLGIPQIDSDLDDLGQAIANLKHRLNAVEGQPPETEL